MSQSVVSYTKYCLENSGFTAVIVAWCTSINDRLHKMYPRVFYAIVCTQLIVYQYTKLRLFCDDLCLKHRNYYAFGCWTMCYMFTTCDNE